MQKSPPARSKALRESARHAECVMCGAVDTVVLAHRNLPGQFGMGMKGPDWWGALLCVRCHEYGDGQGRKDAGWWERAVFKTHRVWHELGIMRIDP